MAKKENETYGADETERRYKDALKRMLSTPHKRHKPLGKKKKKTKSLGRQSRDHGL